MKREAGQEKPEALRGKSSNTRDQSSITWIDGLMHYSRVIQISFKALFKPGLRPQYTRGRLDLYHVVTNMKPLNIQIAIREIQTSG